MKVDVIGSNSLLFANLPPASQVPGRTYRVSDVGPAPGILLTSNGTRWRPAGGRQVLAQRGNNPVTVQALSPGQVAETIGPFPGGLVRSGMALDMSVRYSTPAIGTGNKVFTLRIGTGAARNDWYFINSVTSGADVEHRVGLTLAVRSDTSFNHYGMAPYMAGGYSNNAAYATLTPTVDFSQPWSADIFMRSAAETAVNISSATWAGGIATFNTAADHTLAVGDKTVIAGVTPSGYNGTFIVLSVPTSTQFTVALAANPGAYTSGGASSRISNMISQSYVLELVG